MPNLNGNEIRLLLEQVAIDIESNKDYLCDLDGAVGDGDHGVSMTIGMRAVRRAMDDLPDSPSVQDAFQAASDAYAIEVGATIGPLYEVAFAAAAQASAGKEALNSVSDWAGVYQAMFDAIQQLGGAQLGDKTLLDSFHPAIEALRSSEGSPLSDALASAARTAHEAAEATKDLVPQKGRASRLGDRAMGHQDAGATSLAIILETVAGFVANLRD
ncbi:MAG: PTS-dependent dihydroxyacetone kinase subunit dhaL 3 [Actinomycetota bacterium]|jgi:dihydroxyacetone kinase-like protein